MKQASLVIIGDEILSGRTEDKNLSYLAKWLGRLGINLSEVRVVLDEEDDIIEAVNSLRKKYDYAKEASRSGRGGQSNQGWRYDQREIQSQLRLQ